MHPYFTKITLTETELNQLPKKMGIYLLKQDIFAENKDFIINKKDTMSIEMNQELLELFNSKFPGNIAPQIFKSHMRTMFDFFKAHPKAMVVGTAKLIYTNVDYPWTLYNKKEEYIWNIDHYQIEDINDYALYFLVRDEKNKLSLWFFSRNIPNKLDKQDWWIMNNLKKYDLDTPENSYRYATEVFTGTGESENNLMFTDGQYHHFVRPLWFKDKFLFSNLIPNKEYYLKITKDYPSWAEQYDDLVKQKQTQYQQNKQQYKAKTR